MVEYWLFPCPEFRRGRFGSGLIQLLISTPCDVVTPHPVCSSLSTDQAMPFAPHCLLSCERALFCQYQEESGGIPLKITAFLLLRHGCFHRLMPSLGKKYPPGQCPLRRCPSGSVPGKRSPVSNAAFRAPGRTGIFLFLEWSWRSRAQHPAGHKRTAVAWALVAASYSGFSPGTEPPYRYLSDLRLVSSPYSSTLMGRDFCWWMCWKKPRVVSACRVVVTFPFFQTALTSLSLDYRASLVA